jgi:predicted adenylyl cyclase CyaB
MHEEIEAKVRIAAPEAFRRRVGELGATGGGTVLEVNHIFDSADGSLRKSGAAVRVREECVATGAAAGGEVIRTILAYKGPLQPSRFKRRAEVQTVVADGAAILAILRALGYVETFCFEKRRTAWRMGACEVVLDELPHIGWFAEVEGPSEAAVQKTLADLGLADAPVLAQSYMRLLADYLAGHGRDRTRAVFADNSTK